MVNKKFLEAEVAEGKNFSFFQRNMGPYWNFLLWFSMWRYGGN